MTAKKLENVDRRCAGIQLFTTQWTVTHPAPWDYPDKNTGVSWHFLFKGIFQTQDGTWVFCVSSIGRWILYHWVTWEAPRILLTLRPAKLKTVSNHKISFSWSTTLFRYFMSSGSVVTSKVSPYFCTRVKVSDGYMPRWYKILLMPNAENIRNIKVIVTL